MDKYEEITQLFSTQQTDKKNSNDNEEEEVL